MVVDATQDFQGLLGDFDIGSDPGLDAVGRRGGALSRPPGRSKARLALSDLVQFMVDSIQLRLQLRHGQHEVFRWTLATGRARAAPLPGGRDR